MISVRWTVCVVSKASISKMANAIKIMEAASSIFLTFAFNVQVIISFSKIDVSLIVKLSLIPEAYFSMAPAKLAPSKDTMEYPCPPSTHILPQPGPQPSQLITTHQRAITSKEDHRIQEDRHSIQEDRHSTQVDHHSIQEEHPQEDPI